MSYWYGKVVDIYLKAGRMYGLKYSGTIARLTWKTRMLTCVGEYELILSDLITVVDMCCVEDHATILPYNEGDLVQPQIPIGTLYNRWTIDIKFSRDYKMVYTKAVNIHNSQIATKCACTQCDPAFHLPMTLQRYCRTCHQWFNEECIATLGRQLHKNVKAGLPSLYCDINFDLEFLSLLTLPI
ncbi:uncharacterized protein BJ212DRAFT_1299131 [Suillus subaureus]|uniref:Uncharacterized protein n=1 Tax=Suillus subaureus TaxID=48587 RepID=A0A9P7ED31_9AGAM|nr:uncharacterized protein BJ212DRAFT_1299131 [Suillus subaureus]KAG1817590.1 hypothetical protein BJ212DRAFT_1299131 [Suillus subaureus]